MKVLVAVDSSNRADSVIGALTASTWPENTHFHLITVIEKTSSWDSQQQFLHQGRLILDERLASLKNHFPTSVVDGELLEGSAATTITNTAKQWGAELLVIGSHGDTGRRKPGLGSVAAHIANSAPCTIEIVKVRNNAHNTAVAADLLRAH
ncbi:MAG: universal stress protein [Candidatus Obscuribacterales bacterium]|nr:universal stress protein [Candidatus Obscuribacterales bacterium]